MWMIVLYYLLIGLIISILSWIFFIDKKNQREGFVLIYLPIITILWPIFIIIFVYNIIKFIFSKNEEELTYEDKI